MIHHQFDLPRQPGTYILFLRLETPISLSIRTLAAPTLAPGWIAYVGSAHGPGGLHARINRHLRPDKPRHWHIDALTGAIPVRALWWTVSPARLECNWAEAIRTFPGSGVPVPRFGASDCHCPAHLFSVERDTLPDLWRALGSPVWVEMV